MSREYIVIIVLILLFILFYFYIDDSKKQLSGIWVSSKEFNTNSSISTLALTIDQPLKKGHLTIIGIDDSVICNTDFAISLGKDRFMKSLKYNFADLNATLKYSAESVWPNEVIFSMDYGILYIYNENKELLAQCFRIII
jgi:hypothetical protein